MTDFGYRPWDKASDPAVDRHGIGVHEYGVNYLTYILNLIKPKRLLQNMGLLIVMGIAVHLILPQISALENSWYVLASMKLWAVVLAFLAQILSYMGSGFLLMSILIMAHEKLSIWSSTLIVLGSASVGMIAGGTLGSSVAIFRWTRGEKSSLEGATMAGIYIPLFNNILLVLVSIFGLVYLFLLHNLTLAQVIAFGIALSTLGLTVGAAVLAMRYRTHTLKVLEWISRRMPWLRRNSSDPNAIRRDSNDFFNTWDKLWKGGWHQPAIGAFLNVGFDLLTLCFLFIAAGAHVSLGVLMAGYGLPLLLGKLAFVIPGGVGVVESSMAVLYNGMGVPQAITVVVVLGYRIISFWIPSLLGFPIAAYLQRSQGKFS